MKTKMSSRGQVVLPAALRSRLGIREGDVLEIESGDGCVLLRPEKRRRRMGQVRIDAVTGMPALSAGKNAPVLKASTVESILADFP